MSVTLSQPMTVAQRGALATKRLRAVLGVDDVKLLSTALAEVAAEEAVTNRDFANRVHATYIELAAQKPIRRNPTHKTAVNEVELVPVIDMTGIRIDPFASLDPYLLHRIYGSKQLRAALTGYSLARLKEGLDPVQTKNPGTKPQSKARKDSIIDYIVEHVAGPGY